MIAYLKGKVAAVSEASCVIDVNNVGWLVYISGRDAAGLPPRGQEVQLYTWLSVGQDALRLYGFQSEDDLELFRLLLNVSGVGPKAALGILSVLSADDLRLAVLSDDEKTISRAPGIGGKTAKKIILELKDKLSLEDVFGRRAGVSQNVPARSTVASEAKDEAVQALAALGYSASDALRAVNRAGVTEEMDVETILKLALKQMAVR